MKGMAALEEIYPAFGVRVECGPVVLRPLREADVPAIAELVDGGIHPEEERPFLVPWNLGDYDPIDTLRFYYQTWASFTPERWTIMLAVERDGVLVGVQDVMATDFPLTRSASSGSWLGLPHQGRGTGTLMRQAMLAFAFDGLGAVEMRSGAWVDNLRSRRVSEKCGYRPDGTELRPRERGAVVELRLRVTPDTFVRPPYPVAITGADALRRALRVADDRPATPPVRGGD